jgi:three-Cys-motif partner protein
LATNAQGLLFESLPEFPNNEITFRGLRSPVWTENKARLVAKYLYYFVLITKHGAYIDGFSGPKSASKPNSWAAKLVLESKPKLLREFFLCDVDANKLSKLQELKDNQPKVSGRKIEIVSGDFNEKVQSILDSGVITPKKATFCLLDQFTMECHWATVEKIAKHKLENKIELFYFLASGWLDRALSGFKTNLDKPELWWGKENWRELQGMASDKRAKIFCDRFKIELGYKYSHAWPIYSREADGKRVMFHMIHATDHPEAPKIMWRAYRNANIQEHLEEQLPLALVEVQSILKAYGSE